MKLFIILLILMLLLIFGCAQNILNQQSTNIQAQNNSNLQNVPANLTNPATYAVLANPFYSFEYPSVWQAMQQSEMVILLPPVNATISASIAVIVTKDNSTGLSADFESNVNILREQFPDVYIISFKNTTLSGEPAYLIEYTASSHNQSFEYMQILSLKNNNSYLITYAAPAAEYNISRDYALHLISTFSISNTSQKISREQEDTNQQSYSSFGKFFGAWQLVSSKILYNNNDYNYSLMDSSISINSNYTWSFDNISGTWVIDHIDPLDWGAWGVSDDGSENKITLYGWYNTTVSGPIEKINGDTEGFWLIYNAPGQNNSFISKIQIHFTRFGG